MLFSLADVTVTTGDGEPLRVPGFPDRLPDGVLLRTIAGGTFEATTLRLGVLHALVAAGTVVWNAPVAIERSVDKAMTSLLLARHRIPTPIPSCCPGARPPPRWWRGRPRPGARWCSSPCSARRARGCN